MLFLAFQYNFINLVVSFIFLQLDSSYLQLREAICMYVLPQVILPDPVNQNIKENGNRQFVVVTITQIKILATNQSQLYWANSILVQKQQAT